MFLSCGSVFAQFLSVAIYRTCRLKAHAGEIDRIVERANFQVPKAANAQPGDTGVLGVCAPPWSFCKCCRGKLAVPSQSLGRGEPRVDIRQRGIDNPRPFEPQ